MNKGERDGIEVVYWTECGTRVLETGLASNPVKELEVAEDVGVITVAILEDEGQRTQRAQRLRWEGAILTVFLASMSASLWVFKMLKIQSKRRELRWNEGGWWRSIDGSL
ncbi:hypothetical protein Q3G72_008428 [Acer saccharum]|nr:hypothetical protein Q3G72_008428 [Acer saccharum]